MTRDNEDNETDLLTFSSSFFFFSPLKVQVKVLGQLPKKIKQINKKRRPGQKIHVVITQQMISQPCGGGCRLVGWVVGWVGGG